MSRMSGAERQARAKRRLLCFGLIGLVSFSTSCSNQLPKAAPITKSGDASADQASEVSKTKAGTDYGSKSGDNSSADNGGTPSPMPNPSSGDMTAGDESPSRPEPITGSPSGEEELQAGQAFKNGFYSIRNFYTEKCLIVRDQKRDVGAEYVQGPCDSPTARFQISFMDGKYYRLHNHATQLAMQIKSQLALSEARIDQDEYRARNHQKWVLEPHAGGFVFIKPALNEALCLDVGFGSKENNAFIQLWKDCSAPGQKWVMIELN